MPAQDIKREANFSPDRRFRYSLRRSWDAGHRWLMVMLNPSVADEERDDPTTTFCMRQAMRWGYGSYEAVNLFALVGTSPKCLTSCGFPGPAGGALADQAIKRAVDNADRIVVAWGDIRAVTIGHSERVHEVKRMLPDAVHCFGLTKHGFPRFPRALSRGVGLERWEIR